MITAPRGRGWSVISTTWQGDEAVANAMAGYGPEGHSRAAWASLRKKVEQGRRLPRNF